MRHSEAFELGIYSFQTSESNGRSYSVEYLRRREFSSVNEKSLGRDYEGNVRLNC